MQRDMDLIRKILFDIEAKSTGLGSYSVSIEGYAPEIIGYHNKLLIESGLATGINTTCMGSTHPEFMMIDLTSEGHDFLDAIRSDNIWNSTKDKVNKVGSWTLDIIKAIAVACIKEKVGL